MNWKLKNEHDYLRIEYIILFFIALRLIGITNAPLEIAHNWRQVTGLMVSRNFLEIDATLWLPRVDETNGGTGIIGMEFPLLNYLHYLLSLLFDYNHWYGRLINLAVTSTGIYFFYKLIEDKLSWKTAYYATIFLLGSVWFTYSRKVMPDTFCMGISFIGLYFANLYLKKQQLKHFIFFLGFLTIGFLSKISAVICIVAIPFLMNELQSIKTRVVLTVGLILCLITTYIWYFEWNPYLSMTYGNWYHSGTDIQSGFNELIENPLASLKQFYFSSFHSFLASILFLISCIYLIIHKHYQLLTFLTISLVIFFLYMAKSGSVFYIHTYYIIPIVPVFAIVIGHYLASLKNVKITLGIVLLFLIESIANQQHDFFIKSSETYKLTLEDISSKYSDKTDLIAINGNGNPQELYLSHRKGWVLKNSQCKDPKHIEKIKDKGCKFLFINRHVFEQRLPYKIQFENRDYRIYSISD